MNRSFLIILPTYNEAENLVAMVEALFALAMPGMEILVVDDASPDGTGDLAEGLMPAMGGRLHLLRRKGKEGLGRAYAAGFDWALARDYFAVFEMDADFSHDPTDIPRFMQAIEECDVVLGSRYVSGGSVDKSWNFFRKALSRGGNLYARILTGLPVRDATGGFKCFRTEALKNVDYHGVQSCGYAFQIEMNLACYKKGYIIREIPIYFRERSRGKSKMSWNIVLEALWRVWEIKSRYS